MRDSELFSRPQKSHHNRIRRVSVYDSTCISIFVSYHKERSALRLFQFFVIWWQNQVVALNVLDKEIVNLDSLFLDATWRNVNLFVEFDRNAAASARNPA
jgi:hypothetical protein